MDTKNRVTLLLGAALLFAGATAIQADQLPAPAADRPLSISAVGGAAAGEGNAGGAGGLTIAYDFSDRFAIEARGVYADRGAGQMGADLTASLLVNLMTGRRALPYVAVGGGFYRAMFDLDNPRLFGMMGAWPAGQTFGQGWMMDSFMWNNSTIAGPTFTRSEMPAFYGRRMDSVTSGRQSHMRSFTDPAITVGGGINIALTDTWHARPDVRAVTILGAGDALTIGTVTFSVGYRF